MSARDKTPAVLLPAEVRRHLRTSMWVRLEGGGATGSTNADAAVLARAGAPHGTAVLASRQDAGRGRFGREWVSPEGGVYVSALLRPALPPASLTALPLAIAAGVAEELAGLGADVRVKWPNDLVLDGGKLAGVLLEMSGDAERTEWLVAGVGLNVRRPREALSSAAYLEDAVAGIGCGEATARVLDGIASAYDRLLEAGFEGVRETYEARDVLRGLEVRAADAGGRQLARGRVAGVDEKGRLLLVTGVGPAERTVALAAGDVTLTGEDVPCGDIGDAGGCRCR